MYGGYDACIGWMRRWPGRASDGYEIMNKIVDGNDAATLSRWVAGLTRAFPFALVSVGSLMLAGCATAPPSSDPEAVAEFNETNDPIEPFNRSMFNFNLTLDDYVLSPVARGYRWALPSYVRERVTNFMSNLGEPVTFGNDLAQGNLGRAGTSLARFASNTTIGLAGLYDPAKFWGLQRHDEDFGQTLGTYGTPEGAYLVLPFLGPAPPRDAAGRVVDMAMDPTTWIGGTNAMIAGYSSTGLRITNSRSNSLDTIADLRKTSLDFYAAVRSLYRQNRNAEISNGTAAPAAPGYGGSSSIDPFLPMTTSHEATAQKDEVPSELAPVDAVTTPAQPQAMWVDPGPQTTYLMGNPGTYGSAMAPQLTP